MCMGPPAMPELAILLLQCLNWVSFSFQVWCVLWRCQSVQGVSRLPEARQQYCPAPSPLTLLSLTLMSSGWSFLFLMPTSLNRQVFSYWSVYFFRTFLFSTLFMPIWMQTLYNPQSLVVPELHCLFIAEDDLQILHESDFFNALLTHIVSLAALAGCATEAHVCGIIELPWIYGGLCVQKSTGAVIQAVVRWIWALEDLETATALNL